LASKDVLLTGGRNVGVMDAASLGAKAANGLTIGILPTDDTSAMSKRLILLSSLIWGTLAIISMSSLAMLSLPVGVQALHQKLRLP